MYKILSFSFLLLLTFSIHSCDKTKDAGLDLQVINDGIRKFYAPDKRVAVYDIDLISENGTPISKTMTLNNLRFSQNSALSVNEFETDTNNLKAFPNPMVTHTTLQFTTNQSETIQVVLYDYLGKQVYFTTYNAVPGKNSIILNRENLSSGLYFCKIVSNQYNFNPLKLIIN